MRWSSLPRAMCTSAGRACAGISASTLSCAAKLPSRAWHSPIRLLHAPHALGARAAAWNVRGGGACLSSTTIGASAAAPRRSRAFWAGCGDGWISGRRAAMARLGGACLECVACALVLAVPEEGTAEGGMRIGVLLVRGDQQGRELCCGWEEPLFVECLALQKQLCRTAGVHPDHPLARRPWGPARSRGALQEMSPPGRPAVAGPRHGSSAALSALTSRPNPETTKGLEVGHERARVAGRAPLEAAGSLLAAPLRRAETTRAVGG